MTRIIIVVQPVWTVDLDLKASCGASIGDWPLNAKSRNTPGHLTSVLADAYSRGSFVEKRTCGESKGVGKGVGPIIWMSAIGRFQLYAKRKFQHRQ